MRKASSMNRKNRIILALAVGVVVILAASTIVRCSLSGAGGQLGQTVPATQAQADDDQDEVQAQSEDATTGAEEPMGILKGSVWKSTSGATIAFKDARYVESDGTRSVLSTFDVKSVTRNSSQTEVLLALDKPDGTAKESLVLLRQAADGTWSVSSDDFQISTTYIQGSPSGAALRVVGVNDEYRELLGGTTDALQEAVATYARTHVPSAIEATWTRELVVSYADGTVTSNFTCDDTASTMLTVVYDRTACAFTVMG
jgi:hypothetical protein